ncbi:MAG: ABC transporter permease [Kiritimatiellia bacterium]
MIALRDILIGWRSRPLQTLALAGLSLAVSALIGLGLHILDRTARETDDLLSAWPADQSTLLLSAPVDAHLYLTLLRRLPEGEWLAYKLDSDTAWVEGRIPFSLFQGSGISLPPDLIQRGEPVALVTSTAHPDARPGGLLQHRGQAFRILGVGTLSLPVSRILPVRSQPGRQVQPDHLLIQLPAAEVKKRIQDLEQRDRLTLMDHSAKRTEASAGFQRVKRSLAALTAVVALLVAVLLQSFYQSEIRERKSEFALRRSLGARPADIRNQILLEALLGSACPVVLGLGLFLVYLNPLHILLTLCLTVGWILLCATLPALQAARIPPGEALKGE